MNRKIDSEFGKKKGYMGMSHPEKNKIRLQAGKMEDE